MATEIEVVPYAQSPDLAPQPTTEQLARLDARKRFRYRYIYGPLIVVALLWLLGVGLLLWLTLATGENVHNYREVVSGAADIITILFITPWLFVCALPLAAVVGLVVYRRQNKKGQPEEPAGLPLFWRVENVISKIQFRLDEQILPKVAQPVLTAYGLVAFVRTLFTEIKELITREIDRYVRR